MTTRLLVRHPEPQPTEGLPGYVLRLGEDNGYRSPWDVFCLAGIRQKEMKSSRIRADKLAKVCNLPSARLDIMAHSAPPGQPCWSRLLGHPLLANDLNLTRSRICPRCVLETGIIEAHWELKLMVACPIHRCLALSLCPKCGGPLSWFRPGLLQCKCGGNFQEAELGSVSEAEASLLDLVRRKVLDLAQCAENPAAAPQNQLTAMNLRSLLAIVRRLGKYRMIVGGDSGVISDEGVISGASRVLADWPKNFIGLLQDIGKDLPFDSKAGVRKQFASIYHAIFKTKAIDPPEQIDFLRIAFLQFATNYWGRGCVDPKLMKRVRDGLPQRFVSQTEFAARIGVDPRTAARILKTQNAVSARLSCGKSERIIVDMEHNSIPRTRPGKIFPSREAARRLSVSVPVLQALQKTGSYEVNHVRPSQGGFHECDIEAFEGKLLALGYSTLVPRIEGAHINLGIVMRGHHDSTAIKVQVIQAMLSGELNVVGNIDGTIAGLLLGRIEYERFIEKSRDNMFGNATTPVSVAQVLRCDPASVPELMRLGYLSGRKTGVGLRVTRSSIDEFTREYASLASVAKSERTSSRALMHLCEEHGIALLSVSRNRRAGPQAFIRLADKGKLDVCRKVTANPRRSKQPNVNPECGWGVA